ncbi:MAG: TonB-dependent receptor, partial [Methylococcales bacterium]|nr:TonB-dependent receptor [Methylococcales bacterium]
YGDTLMDKGHYRIFAKYRNQDNGVSADGSKGSDGSSDFRTGFRIDWQHNENNQINLNGNLYQGTFGTRLSMLSPQSSPSARLADFNDDVWGGNIQVNWSQTSAQEAKQAFRFYYEYENRDSWFADSERGTVDLNYQYSFTPWKQHELTTGIGYRYRYDSIPVTNLTQARILFKNTGRQTHLASAFIQDRITLLENSVWLTLGSKFEYNSYTDFEIQPSARLSWRPVEKQLLWASVSRAARTPSRWEHDTEFFSFGSALGNMAIGFQGNSGFGSEALIAYELGYRFEFNKQLQLDLALFYNDYDNIVMYKLDRPTALPQINPLTALMVLPENLIYGESYGIEMAINWQPTSRLRVRGSYSFIDIQLHTHVRDDLSTIARYEGSTPEQQASLQSSYQLLDPLTLNIFARYVDPLSYTRAKTSDYVNLDIGLQWNPSNNMAISLYARDLLDREHFEFIENDINLQSTQTEREAYLKVDWHF